MAKFLSYSDKVRKFKNGSWKADAPPVCANQWPNFNWIIWIDNHGVWL